MSKLIFAKLCVIYTAMRVLPCKHYLRLQEEEDSDVEDKTSAESSDSGSDFSSDIYSLTLNEAGPEMVVLGTLRKVRRVGGTGKESTLS